MYHPHLELTGIHLTLLSTVSLPPTIPFFPFSMFSRVASWKRVAPRLEVLEDSDEWGADQQLLQPSQLANHTSTTNHQTYLTTMSKPLRIDHLEDSDRSRKLGIIDKLRELGIGDDISLPQLVVEGDQSSGKSSLLEGLTELPFPVAGQLCTRFATQVSFRRLKEATSQTVVVTIFPPADSSDAHKNKMAAFKSKVRVLNQETFAKVLDEVRNH